MTFVRSRYTSVFATALLSGLLAGCLTGENLGVKLSSLTAPDIETAITYPILGPDGREIASQDLAAEDRSLLLALKARLDGHDSVATQKALSAAGPDSFPVAVPGLQDFDVASVTLIEGAPGNTRGQSHELAGLMRLRDAAGRRLDLAFMGSGQAAAEGLRVNRLSATAVFAPHPMTEAFIVPVSRIDERFLNRIDDYQAFYAGVEAAALDTSVAGGLPGGSAEYLLVVFVKDLLPSGSDFDIQLVASPDSGRGESEDSFYKVYDGGWVIGLATAELDLAQGAPRWLEASFATSEDGRTPVRQARLVGLYPVTGAARTALQSSARPAAQD